MGMEGQAKRSDEGSRCGQKVGEDYKDYGKGKGKKSSNESVCGAAKIAGEED